MSDDSGKQIQSLLMMMSSFDGTFGRHYCHRNGQKFLSGQGHFVTSHLGDKNFCPFRRQNVAQMSRQISSHTPSALNAGAKRSDVPYGHASMLLLGEGSEATEQYNKYANLFKYRLIDQFDQPIWSTFLSPM